MAARIQVPDSAVRTREQILADQVVIGAYVWVTCWNCGGSGNYPSSMTPPGRCRLLCWCKRDGSPREHGTYGRHAVPIEKFVKREIARDRKTYRDKVQWELDAPRRAIEEAERARVEAERAVERARREAEKAAERAAILAEKAKRQHVGAIGERIRDVPATAERVSRFEARARYGGIETRYVVRFRDANSNLLIAFADHPHVHIDADGNPLPEWRNVLLSGTVKKHETYSDEAQTVLQRIKVVQQIALEV